jgi:hypothetical protein
MQERERKARGIASEKLLTGKLYHTPLMIAPSHATTVLGRKACQ